MPENPYTPAAIAKESTSTPLVEHTTSILTEAWRGAKFGAKITAWIFGGLMCIIGLLGLISTVYMLIITQGRFAESIDYLEILKGVGGAIVGVALTSFYGGIAGAIVMAVAALFRKRFWKQKKESI